jgi:hypothetical protein
MSVLVLIGLGTEFRSEKIPRNRLGTLSVIPRKKVLIPSSVEEPNPKLGTERNRILPKNEFERNSLNIEQNIFLPGWWKPIRSDSTRTHNLTTVGDFHCRVLFRVVFSAAEWFGTEFRVVFSSPEGFGREFREFACISVPLSGIPSCFLFR